MLPSLDTNQNKRPHSQCTYGAKTGSKLKMTCLPVGESTGTATPDSDEAKPQPPLSPTFLALPESRPAIPVISPPSQTGSPRVTLALAPFRGGRRVVCGQCLQLVLMRRCLCGLVLLLLCLFLFLLCPHVPELVETTKRDMRRCTLGDAT